MTVKLRRSLVIGTFSLAACMNASGADEPIALFDGTSLDGWKVTKENPGSFRVEDGAIVTDGPRAHLYYDGPAGTEFTDFELTMKVKTTPGSNSGVFFHTQYQASDWPKHGFEAQVNATQSDPRKTGSIYAVADIRVYPEGEDHPALGYDTNAFVELPSAPHADDAWFSYTIRVESGKASISVNGDLLVAWTQPQDWPDDTRRLGSGTFALQAHDPDSVVYFKDIKVKRLDTPRTDKQ